MSRRLFDGVLLLVAGLFIYQAFITPMEDYDVMGPRLWPMGVAFIAASLIFIIMMTNRLDAENENTLNLRFWFFGFFIFGCVAVLSLGIVPFFIPSAILCFVSYLLLAKNNTLLRTAIAAGAALSFCFTLQLVFTTVVHLDLPTSF